MKAFITGAGEAGIEMRSIAEAIGALQWRPSGPDLVNDLEQATAASIP
ncbi:hypothetical protein [Pseudochelatococcus sp.]